MNALNQFKFARNGQNITFKTIFMMKNTWSEVRKWTTAYFSNISINLAFSGAVAVPSILKSETQFVKKYGNNIVDYCIRTYCYLNAAKDYERTLYEMKKKKDIN